MAAERAIKMWHSGQEIKLIRPFFTKGLNLVSGSFVIQSPPLGELCEEENSTRRFYLGGSIFSPFMINLGFMMDFLFFHNKIILDKIYPLIWSSVIITTQPNQLQNVRLAWFQYSYVVSDLKTEFQ